MLQVPISSIVTLLDKSLEESKAVSSEPEIESSIHPFRDLHKNSRFEGSLADIVRCLSSTTLVEQPCIVDPE